MPRMEILRGFWVSKGVTPVYRKGDVAIFAVNSQFTDKELQNMRRDALEHGSDELPELSPSDSQPQTDPSGSADPSSSGIATWNTMDVFN